MKQLTYAMQFTGLAGPGEKEGTMAAKTSAGSCRITSTVTGDGLSGVIESSPGSTAAFESVVTLTGESSFVESGSIHFGAGHSIRFSTVGQGYLGASADPALRHGTINWRVDGGEGQFTGASGLITSNFTVGPNGEVVDNHFGLMFVK